VRNISNWGLYLGIKFGLTRPNPIYFSTRSGVKMNFKRPGTLSLTGAMDLHRTLYKLSIYKKDILMLFFANLG